MDLTQLKTQVLTMFMMKSSSQPAKNGFGDIFTMIYSMLLMNMVEQALKYLPAISVAFQTWAKERWGKNKPKWMPLDDKPSKEKEIINSVTMTRTYPKGEKTDRADNVYVEKVDAVLDYICALDNARHVRMDTRYSLNSTEEIELTPLLKARVKQSALSEDGSSTELIVYSTVLKVSEIRAWVDEVHDHYVAEKNNKLGNKIYYFNELTTEPIMMSDMSVTPPRMVYKWDNMPKMLTFNMNEFRTSKSFTNVYGHHVDELKERLDLFVNHPDWYMERGIPHSLGIMLHGVPGAGKTSTIKAIARDTHRHIFNLSLRPYTTQRQLTNLFFNETVVVNNYDGGKQTLKIPLNKRVYVIEDIDCLTDVVLDRGAEARTATAQKDGDAVTLSFLLNLLDGVLETPGRILVITSNYPERLDRALVRPGRIDVKIEFGYANRTFILDMINKFYDASMTIEDIPETIADRFTPAEVMESMCANFKNSAAALTHLAKKANANKLLEAEEAEEVDRTSLKALGIIVETPEQPAPAILYNEIVGSPEKPTLVVKNELVSDRPTNSFATCDVCKNTYNSNYLAAVEEHANGKCAIEKPTFITNKPDIPIVKKKYEYDYKGKTIRCGIDHGPTPTAILSCTNCSVVSSAYDKELVAEKTLVSMMFGGSDDKWGTAMFEDVVIPEGAGGRMPWECGGIRSEVDLNMVR
jgi:DNA polymerase III delta prime subunit